MKIWTVANQKGGVGKTTTTVSLGGILAEQGHRVLLIDTDPHASLTYYFGIDSEELEVSVYDIFIRGNSMTGEEILQALCPSTIENLDILPATMAIATLDRSMGNKTGMGLILKKSIEKIADQYDYAILDCPPVLGVLMVNALAASERILVPVQTEFLALKGLDRMMRTMELMQSSQQKQYQYTIIPTMYDKRTKASLEAYKTLLATYKDAVWPGVVPVDTKFRDASLAQQVPVQFCPKSRGVFAYRALLDYLKQLS
ncbi:ParA family protein [Pseudoalteromonas sp. McH1-7]|uniref:Chromosome partitioning protein n=1 Tax=Pseudoalteromonas peptidolytica F12-50-A1 TaxID=1315280 RepID=A0A8I0MVV7_9GAMM|nr:MULTISPECIES: ParA family protein [Pseudoalteromonas]NUZ09545.1 ParA family protein [Pseudoalteromonas sp. McH1-7]MBE0346837.1 chromosome partitioning protein [Pseudoalteromonas peptidolytica F12-50-A1]MDW7550006.1 ParA family protein [Pseudoalteromonas peptidolytica]NLR13740.1 ParA family protein [Pseudoalteromonas peptidolytica]RRS08986.1 ParA family protein [Pseudoalteromonas sp. J010]